jgi:hypothetical protein
VGSRPNEHLSFFFPEDFVTLPEPVRRASRETLKLIVSTQCADFQSLFQSGYRFRGTSKDGIARSLDEVLAAKLDSDGYHSTLRSVGEDWTTVERSFRLLPRPDSQSSS